MAYQISGRVKVNGANKRRQLHVYKRLDGSFLKTIYSDEQTGYYETSLFNDDTIFVAVMEETTEQVYESRIMDFVVPYFIPSEYQADILASSPIAYWRLDEPSGVVANDLGSGANNGSYVGSPTLGVAGLISDGTCMSTATNNDYMSVGTTQLLNNTLPFSIELWFEAAAYNTAFGMLISINTGVASQCFQMFIHNGTIGGYRDVMFGTNNGTTFGRADADIPGGGLALAGNGRHHIVYTYVGSLPGTLGSYSLYFDGNPVTLFSGPLFATGNDNTEVPGLVINANMSRLNGKVDEVAIYHTELSPAVVLAHYNAGL